jgi:hypothetical protein
MSNKSRGWHPAGWYRIMGAKSWAGIAAFLLSKNPSIRMVRTELIVLSRRIVR